MPIDSHQCLLQLPSYKCPATTRHRYSFRHSKDLQEGEKGGQGRQLRRVTVVKHLRLFLG